jgi:TPR repeat protein
MKKVNFNLLAAIFAVALFFNISCASMFEGSSQKGNLNKAKKFQRSAFDRMHKYGDTDAESLKLFDQAIEEHKKCIADNNKNTADAYHNIGIIYYMGPKSLRDYPVALDNLFSAMEIYENDKKKNVDLLSECYNRIGTVMYRMGDYYGTFDYWQKASALSFRSGDEAQIYWLGLGVEQDLSEAMAIYRIAASAGRDLWANIYALDYQIKEYIKGNFDNDGMYLFMDYLHAKTMGEPNNVWMSILKQSADLNWPPAQVDYWIFCRDSEPAKGLPYLKKAADAKFTPAYFHMGYLYQMGYNQVRINYQEAAKWYEKAAVEGFPLAQNNLANLYFNNEISAARGVSNKEMANYWWSIASDQGLAIATQNKALVEDYRPPMSAIEASIRILNSVTSIINASKKTYNSVNKSGVQGYVPPSGGAQRTAQNNTSTASSSSSSSSSRDSKTDKQCPTCNGTKKCNFSYIHYPSGCYGTGYLGCSYCREKGIYKDKTCPECNGSKKVKCGICHGSGKCSRCNGTGRI